MAKSKGIRVVITMECRSEEGVYRYTTTKNRRNTPNKLELKKYCHGQQLYFETEK